MNSRRPPNARCDRLLTQHRESVRDTDTPDLDDVGWEQMELLSRKVVRPTASVRLPPTSPERMNHAAGVCQTGQGAKYRRS